MARYVKDLVLNKPDNLVTLIMTDYLQKNQFVVAQWEGEPAYRAGALIEGNKYLKWSYENGTLHLEAWMKSLFGREMGLGGFWGAFQKKTYREGLEQLFHVLEQAVPEASERELEQVNAAGDAGHQASRMAGSDPVIGEADAATMALVLGILAFGVSLLSPVISVILAVVALNRAKKGRNSNARGRAKAGRIFSIIAIVLSVILEVTNIVLTVMVG